MSEAIDVFTPLDVERKFRVPRSTQKKARANGSFAPYFCVGRRVYYLRASFENWIADQEQQAKGVGVSGECAQEAMYNSTPTEVDVKPIGTPTQPLANEQSRPP